MEKTPPLRQVLETVPDFLKILILSVISELMSMCVVKVHIYMSQVYKIETHQQ